MSYRRLGSVLGPFPERRLVHSRNGSRCAKAAVYTTAIGVGVVTGLAAVVSAYGHDLFDRFTSGRS